VALVRSLFFDKGKIRVAGTVSASPGNDPVCRRFHSLLGSQIFGLRIRTPGDWLNEQLRSDQR
jgi:hypothetical protein